MTAVSQKPQSQRARRAGWILSGLAVLFLLFDTGMKVLGMRPAVDGSVQLGYPASTVLPIGLVELACLILYVFPATAPIGAVLFTGYLGGAVATHVRMGSPLFTHILFPVYVAGLLWTGLYLRDARVRALVSRSR